MPAELFIISSMREIEMTVKFFFGYASKIKNSRPTPILSKFEFLKDIEIDENLTYYDRPSMAKIPRTANIKKVCINCGKNFKTRFKNVDLCSMKCKKEMDGENQK